MYIKTKSLLMVIIFLVPGHAFSKASLDGGPAVVKKYIEYALNNNFPFIEDNIELDKAVTNGVLTHIVGNYNYEVADDVAQQFLRPKAKRVLEILSHQFKRSCGEVMRVTGAARTRRYNETLPNSIKESLHMTGLAFDIGAKGMSRRCRSWIESRLLYLEGEGYLDATKEIYRPHYHVVVYITNFDEVAISELKEQFHVVESGESFYQIAKTYGIRPKDLMNRNGLRQGDIIHPGDKLILPIN